MYIKRLLSSANTSELWKTYGFIISYVGSGDFPASKKKLYGLYLNDISLSTGANLMNAAGGSMGTDFLKGVGNAISDFIGSKFGNAGQALSNYAKEHIRHKIGYSIAETIKVYEGPIGKPTFTIDTFFIPGLLDLNDYKEIEEFAAYSTLPKKQGTEQTGFSQHIYDPGKTDVMGFIDLSKDLFAVKINNVLNVPGGMYITSFNREYSNDRDENGKPIYCKASITLEYYREMFADEFLKLFSEN